ncbi:NUDIX hydrolase [Candidatus Pacearchaeota archaeon]|nr:NUDIX hydrolase [Candidatus Pacearchaeota archaeon]
MKTLLSIRKDLNKYKWCKNMPAEKISLNNAKKDKLFYFVANVVVFREEDRKCLILKRDVREKVHPGKYAVPGGKLEWSNLDINNPTRINGDVLDFENAVENLLKREVKEEAGIEIDSGLKYINSVAFIRPDGIPVVLVKFAAKYKSGEVILEQGAFTDFKWVDDMEARSYDCIEGIHKEIEETINLFKP